MVSLITDIEPELASKRKGQKRMDRFCASACQFLILKDRGISN
jgi:hypothetical protein